VGLKVDRPQLPLDSDFTAAAAAYRAEAAQALRTVVEDPAFQKAAAGCAERLRLAGGLDPSRRLSDVGGSPSPKCRGWARSGTEGDRRGVVRCRGGVLPYWRRMRRSSTRVEERVNVSVGLATRGRQSHPA
jgi:hypothetical protein